MTQPTSAVEFEGLLPYCLGEQEAKIKAIIDCGGNVAEAARQIGINIRPMREAVRRVRARAAQAGFVPDLGLVYPASEGIGWKGASVFHPATPEAPAQWVKYTKDHARQMQLYDAMFSALADDLPRLAPIPAPKSVAPDLMNLMVLTDTHVGMGAWAKESGHDWDLAIAERTLVSAALAMMDRAPKADTCMIAELGDWNHYDGHVAKTPIHGHPLDAAGRPNQMIDASIRILRRIVDAALKRHKKVVLLVAEGNHDKQSYKWLRGSMAGIYEREKRLEIITEESPFYAHRFGRNMLAFHHGHTAKHEVLPAIFADLYGEMWGRCEHREAHCGHLHHKSVKDYRGMTVCQHDTISPNDAHGASLGFKARRRAEIITYHKDYGRDCEHYITAKRLHDQLALREAA